MAGNFNSALLVLGGVGLAVHYEQLSELYNGVPLIMAYGQPVSGKSVAVEAAMAVIGQDEKTGGKIEHNLVGVYRNVLNTCVIFDHINKLRFSVNVLFFQNALLPALWKFLLAKLCHFGGMTLTILMCWRRLHLQLLTRYIF